MSTEYGAGHRRGGRASPALAFGVRVLVVAASLWVATVLVDGIELGASSTSSRIGTLLVVALIFGVVNAVVKPLIKVVGCPLYVLTLGLIGLVVNALLFWLVGGLASAVDLPFVVDGFWPGFWGAIIVAIVSFVLHMIIPDRIDAR
ncbi:phage holin family protein [Pseudonocardia sp. KRD291]|uniref:phage holin family protein n=1 Tax=Pseudonocardia sp. KRD291 TaxID=2792007 RepID=UPI001C4A0927|nr:phage holin family protein [Pseudonocardia sp. KRD291]MBW0102317.1 phage holin family protein [Pseudonocardia sp. KRD291]